MYIFNPPYLPINGMLGINVILATLNKNCPGTSIGAVANNPYEQ
jgi:hypothetical protein